MSRRTLLFLLTLATLLAVALSTGAAIYYLLFGMLQMMLLSSLISTLVTLLTLRIGSDTPTQRLSRGEDAQLYFTIRHTCPLPISAVELSLATPDDVFFSRVIVSIRPFRHFSVERSLPCPHRGVYEMGVVSVAVRDVFSLITLSRKVRGVKSVAEVSPRVYPLRPIQLTAGDSGAETITRMTEDMSCPVSVRDYREGDTLKKIHWKLTMRRMEPVVRTYEESIKPDTLILMATQPVSAMHETALTITDALCETAASVARAQLRAGYPVRMPLMGAAPREVSGRTETEFPRFTSALTHCAFDCPASYETVLMVEMRRMQRTGGVVLVTPRLSLRIADIAMQMRRMGLTVCVYWITDSRRADTMALLGRLSLSGVSARWVDPLRVQEIGSIVLAGM